MILPEVDQAILDALRAGLSGTSKIDIVIQKSDGPPKKTPAIFLWNRAFTAADTSIGGNAPESGQNEEDGFDGDGKRTEFKLSDPPLRSRVIVEYPTGKTKREGKDFTVDYASGVLTFQNPPEKGRKNVIARYTSGKGAGEVKGLRLKLRYNVDIWTSEPVAGGSVANQVASAVLLSQDSLASKGIQLRLLRGHDLSPQDGVSAGLFCKRLECIAEADLLVKIPYTRMEKILLKAPEKKS